MGSQTFTANGTWVVPAGVTSFNATVKGAGAGGAYNTLNQAAGGGAGEARVLTAEACTPAESLDIVRGLGGTGNGSTNGPGGAGGLTTLKRGATILAQANGAPGGMTGGSGGSGGVGTNGVDGLGTGEGGTGPGGLGGAGGNGEVTQPGENGGNGSVIITWTDPEVTVALTGQALTATQGSITEVRTKALTGQILAAAQGTITEIRTKALSGQSMTIARGTVEIPVGGTGALTGQNIPVTGGATIGVTSIGLTAPLAAS